MFYIENEVRVSSAIVKYRDLTVQESLTVFFSKMQLSSPGDHISLVFSIKLLLKLIWLKVSSAFQLGQRQQWNFPSLSCGV